MKRKILLWTSMLIALCVLLPYAVISSDTRISVPPEAHYDDASIELSVYLTEKNKTIQISLGEYIEGVMQFYMKSDMSFASYEAMSIVVRTYAASSLYSDKFYDKHLSADLCDDEDCCLGFVNKTRRQTANDSLDSVYTADALNISTKVKRAVSNTHGKVIVYNGELINPFFFISSWGKTESSLDVLGYEIEYLKSVDSAEGNKNIIFSSKHRVNFKDFLETARKYPIGKNIDYADYKHMKIASYNESGSVKDVNIGDNIILGSDFAQMYGLKSSFFVMDIKTKDVTFTVYGQGSGLGMSLYGASYMGKKGYGADEIIKHYYSGVEILNIYDFCE